MICRTYNYFLLVFVLCDYNVVMLYCYCMYVVFIVILCSMCIVFGCVLCVVCYMPPARKNSHADYWEVKNY